MFTSLDKALVALVMSSVYFAAQFGVIPADFISESTVQSAVAIIGPALVWLVPNRA